MYAITDQYILNVSHNFFKISKKSTVEITACSLGCISTVNKKIIVQC